MAAKKGSLKRSFLIMTIVPIVALGVIIAVFSSFRFRTSINAEVENELRDTAYVIVNAYDRMYPGDYSIKSSDKLSALVKGGKYMAETNDFINNIKEDTKFDISFFYGDTRYMTTLEKTGGESILGTTINHKIKTEVLDDDTARFYNNVKLNGESYAAFYMPLHNADGSAVGMIGVTKKSKEISVLVRKAISPIFIIAIIVMLIAGVITINYSKKVVGAFGNLRRFLTAVEKGSLDTTPDVSVIARDDEIGQMAKLSVSMQKSIKQLVERDTLTGLFNRRYGNNRMDKAYTKAAETGNSLCMCIGDIDFFKNFNDTYGHDVGDIVLVEVSKVLKRCMTGRGFVARWGGEEFLLFYENVDIEDAINYQHEILEEIHKIVIMHEGSELRINMSFGIVQAKIEDNETIDETLKRADDLLYYAKEHGRNQVVSETLI